MTVGPENLQVGEDIFTAENGFHEIPQEAQQPTPETINNNNNKKAEKNKSKRKGERPSTLEIPTKKTKTTKTKSEESSSTLPSGASPATNDAAGAVPVQTCPLVSAASNDLLQEYHKLCHRYERLRNHYHMLKRRRSKSEPPIKRARREEEDEEEGKEDWFFIVAQL